jgi:hypothetical protein
MEIDTDLANQAQAAQQTNDWMRAAILWRQAAEATDDSGERERCEKLANWCDDMAALVDEIDDQPQRNRKDQTMKTYYVATLARYVLVEADDETTAREVGQAALHTLYADVRERLGKEVPIEIRTIREATRDEIELWNWHHQMLAAEPMDRIPSQGDRIRLLAMLDDPAPIQVGQLGTVVSVSRHGDGKDTWHQIDVAWDNGRTLMVVSPPDRFELVRD